jgi:hypothetical protein
MQTVGAERVTVYIHVMAKHIPGELRMHGDLRPFSTQGGEHKNKIRKLRAHMFTNKRTRTVATSEGGLAKDGSSRGKVVNKDYNHQLMEVEAATTDIMRAIPGRLTALQRKQQEH